MNNLSKELCPPSPPSVDMYTVMITWHLKSGQSKCAASLYSLIAKRLSVKQLILQCYGEISARHASHKLSSQLQHGAPWRSDDSCLHDSTSGTNIGIRFRAASHGLASGRTCDDSESAFKDSKWPAIGLARVLCDYTFRPLKRIILREAFYAYVFLVNPTWRSPIIICISHIIVDLPKMLTALQLKCSTAKSSQHGN